MATEKRSLKTYLSDLARAPLSAKKQYYGITLLGSESGRVEWGCHGFWVGYDDPEGHREIRKGRLMGAVEAEKVAGIWRRLGEYCLVVHDETDLFAYLMTGGHALVEKALVELRAELREMVKPQVAVRAGPTGFVVASSLPPGSFNHAPTPKLRMRVLKRDDYRCRLCGRRASDHVDIELHVHHIRPWGNGGVTIEQNLITLCHTCHKGLNPHEEWNLFGMKARTNGAENPLTYQDRVLRYRERVMEIHRSTKSNGGEGACESASLPLERTAVRRNNKS